MWHDTADVYGLGHNEELVGRAIAGRRDGVAALDVQLNPDDLAELDAVASTSAVAGERTGDMTWVAGTTPAQTASN